MPVICERQEENGCRWAIWRIDETVEELLDLSRSKNVRARDVAEIKHPRRKLEHLSTRLLLEYLTNSEAVITNLPNGKPLLVNGEFEISLSHTFGYSAAIVHPTNPVGIDIEAMTNQVVKVKERFLSPNELSAIDLNQEVTHLLVHWSAKESVFKAMGEDEVDFKDHMQVQTPFSLKTEGLFSIKEFRTQSHKVYPISYISNADFVLTYTHG